MSERLARATAFALEAEKLRVDVMTNVAVRAN
jgi:hypothetical protein